MRSLPDEKEGSDEEKMKAFRKMVLVEINKEILSQHIL